MHRGRKRLDTSTQGEYTKSKPAFENLKDFNVSKKELQILPLRPAFLTTEAVTGNDMGDETVAQIYSASLNTPLARRPLRTHLQAGGVLQLFSKPASAGATRPPLSLASSRARPPLV